VLSIIMVDLTCAGSSKNPCLLGSVNQRGLLLKSMAIRDLTERERTKSGREPIIMCQTRGSFAMRL
jgi:hypothetical protein